MKIILLFVVAVLAGCGSAGGSSPNPVSVSTAKAGAPQSHFVGELIALDGSQSTSSTGDQINYQWGMVTRPSGSSATINNPTTALPTFTADQPGLYLAKLVVSGPNSTTSESTVEINVSPALLDLIVIGNSLTQHGEMPTIGWNGSWGMAASSADKDFSHLVAASLNIPLTSASNFSAIELDPINAAGTIITASAPVKTTSMVIVEFGDNVGNLSEFTPQYESLLNAVKHAQILVCTSTWWRNDLKDTMIKSACQSRGGHYVFIGDIYSDPASQDKLGIQFSDPGVNAHPHDWGMAKIAERIVASTP